MLLSIYVITKEGRGINDKGRQLIYETVAKLGFKHPRYLLNAGVKYNNRKYLAKRLSLTNSVVVVSLPETGEFVYIHHDAIKTYVDKLLNEENKKLTSWEIAKAIIETSKKGA